MSKSPRREIFENVANWRTFEVLSLLRKNGLEQCCNAIEKRQIDGDEFLHLTEGKLSLWKNDLSKQTIRDLRTFIEEFKKNPEKYLENNEEKNNQEYTSDTSSWGTEFDDENEEVKIENNKQIDTGPVIVSNNIDFHKSLRIFRQNITSREESIPYSIEKRNSMYVNYEFDALSESAYANVETTEIETNINNDVYESKNRRKSFVEQLQEQLVSLQSCTKKENFDEEDVNKNLLPQPQASFLHKCLTVKRNGPNHHIKKMSVPPPPKPATKIRLDEKIKENSSTSLGMIKNFDLVANLPIKSEGSEDEYEAFEHSGGIVKATIARVDSKKSLNSINQSSQESIYYSNSFSSCQQEEEQEGINEIYESISENYENDDCEIFPLKTNTEIPKKPPPLPPKPPLSNASSITSLEGHKNEKERSVDKKSATLPHLNCDNSATNERATRPLPSPPEKRSHMDKPWFHDVTREQALLLIKDQITYGTAKDGYFLLRPSTSNPNHPMVLSLWYKDRVYNVPIRKRPDNRFALGTEKPNEQFFITVDEIIFFYKKEDLILYTNGMEMGSTKLTETPAK